MLKTTMLDQMILLTEELQANKDRLTYMEIQQGRLSQTTLWFRDNHGEPQENLSIRGIDYKDNNAEENLDNFVLIFYKGELELTHLRIYSKDLENIEKIELEASTLLRLDFVNKDKINIWLDN